MRSAGSTYVEVAPRGEQAGAQELLADGVGARHEHGGPPEGQELADRVVAGHRDDDVRFLVVRREVGLEVEELDVRQRAEALQDRSPRSGVDVGAEDHGRPELDGARERAQTLEVGRNHGCAVGAAAGRDQRARRTLVRRGGAATGRRRYPQKRVFRATSSRNAYSTTGSKIACSP